MRALITAACVPCLRAATDSFAAILLQRRVDTHRRRSSDEHRQLGRRVRLLRARVRTSLPQLLCSHRSEQSAL